MKRKKITRRDKERLTGIVLRKVRKPKPVKVSAVEVLTGERVMERWQLLN